MINNKSGHQVGIMTYHYANNYGAVLQAYALQEFILSVNNCENVEFINFIPHVDKEKKQDKLFCEKTKLYIQALGIKYRKLLRPRSLFMSKLVAKKFADFRRHYLIVSKECNNLFELNYISKKYDVFIVGSDQVWNSAIAQIPEAYYFSFVGSGSLNSFAASFGKDKLLKVEIELCKKYLHRFNHIYVREQSAKEILGGLGISSNVVLDPVFLLRAKQWKIVETPIKLDNKYVFFYLMEKVKDIDVITTYFKNRGYTIYYCDANGQTGTVNGKCLDFLSPGEFVYVIENAKYVVTNSFHGTAFAIIFGTHLLTIEHSKRNIRLYNILSMINMSDKQIKKNKLRDANIDSMIIDAGKCNINDDIDFAKKAVIKILAGD